MDSYSMLYVICTLAVLTYFVFAITSTWLFAKVVLRIMPDGRRRDKNNEADKVSEGETSKAHQGTGQSGPDNGDSA